MHIHIHAYFGAQPSAARLLARRWRIQRATDAKHRLLASRIAPGRFSNTIKFMKDTPDAEAAPAGTNAPTSPYTFPTYFNAFPAKINVFLCDL